MGKSQPYYFPHFISARNDSKILKLRRILGLEGYAIYFMLLEILREQNDFKLPLETIPELEFEFRTSKEKINNVIFDYELFIITENKFFSPKLIEYLQPYLEKSDRARAAVNKRWEIAANTKEDTNVDTKGILLSNISNKVSNINNNKREAIKKELYGSLIPFIDQYGKNMIRSFYEYWIEPNKSGSKLRIEGEKYFDIGRRLSTWAKRDKEFNKIPANTQTDNIPSSDIVKKQMGLQ